MTTFEQPEKKPDTECILRSVGQAAYEWRLDSDVLLWDESAPKILGLHDIGAVSSGTSFARFVQASEGQSRSEILMQTGQVDGGEGVPYQMEYAFKSPGDEVVTWIEDSGRWFAGPDGKPLWAHGIIRKINERHAREQDLIRQAHFDPLTGELNRNKLMETLATTLEETIRFRGSCGFLLISIDHLGRLNDAYGFEITEEVIAQVARRIRPLLRGKDHLGRLAGNKFGVVLTSCTVDEMAVASERLLVGVRDKPIETSAGPVAVTITIGGVTAPRHARTVSEVLARVSDASHAARDKRVGSFAAYRPSVERDAQRKENLRVTDEIVAALNDRRIALAFEPVVGAKNGQVAFYECLMRVHRSDGAIAHAGEIVPVAERVGLIRMLDYRVLEMVVAELATSPTLVTSVNVSPASTIDPDWWAGLGALLRANPGAGERLIIEITETAAIQDIDDARGFVTRVKDLGCRIAMDDFGAGHTSFRNLRRLGVDIVKIDGAFVQNILKSNDDRAFVQTLVDLSRRLGLQSVAEWVQNQAAADMLAEWGCDYLQGELMGLATAERPWLKMPEKAIGQ